MKYPYFLIMLTLAIFSSNKSAAQQTREAGSQCYEFYLGTYTSGSSQGIYKYTLRSDGRIDSIGLMTRAKNPSFITKSQDGNYLLAVNEEVDGTVQSFKIEENYLSAISQSPSGEHTLASSRQINKATSLWPITQEVMWGC